MCHAWISCVKFFLSFLHENILMWIWCENFFASNSCYFNVIFQANYKFHMKKMLKNSTPHAKMTRKWHEYHVNFFAQKTCAARFVTKSYENFHIEIRGIFCCVNDIYHVQYKEWSLLHFFRGLFRLHKTFWNSFGFVIASNLLLKMIITFKIYGKGLNYSSVRWAIRDCNGKYMVKCWIKS